MKNCKRKKPYWEMNKEELAAATAEFDKECLDETFPEPPPEAKAQLERAMRKRGRPRNGNGAKAISVTLERGLLKRSDRAAHRLGLSRSALIAHGLRSVLQSVGEKE